MPGSIRPCWCRDRPSKAADRETQPRPLWFAFGAYRTAGSARTDAGRTGELGEGGRACSRNGRGQHREGSIVHAKAAVTPAVPGASCSRARDRAGSAGLARRHSRASPSIWSKGWTSCCHGIGAPPSRTLIKPPAEADPPAGLRRMLTPFRRLLLRISQKRDSSFAN